MWVMKSVFALYLCREMFATSELYLVIGQIASVT